MARKRSAHSTSRRAHTSPSAILPHRTLWLWFGVLAAVTALAYRPVWHAGLLWDDSAHLTAESLRTWTGLGRLWTDFTVSQQYYPVTSTAFWIMARLWDTDTFGYHVVNIALHAASACLVTVILRRLSVPGALLAGTVFALHPVFVESVAWISELKNTLSGVLYLSAFFIYLHFDQSRRRATYLAALAVFALALGAKSVTASWPAAVLVVLWWQRGRLDWRKDVAPLAPFFVLGMAAGIGTAWLEYHWVGAAGSRFDLGLVERLLLPGRIVWFYLASLVWPSNLMFNYPRWTVDAGVWWQYLYPLALLAILAACYAARSRTRAPLAAALFFVGTLFPALGLLNVFPFRYSYVADHFQYLASLGVITAASALIATALEKWWAHVHPVALAAAVAAPLALMTFQYSHHFSDVETLYRETIARNPDSFLARTNLAALLLDGPSSGWAEAAAHVEHVLSRDRDDVRARNLLGLSRQRTGQMREALVEFEQVTRLAPELAEGHYNLGLTLAELGRPAEAVAPYERALALFPQDVRALNNLANVLRQLRRHDEALVRIRAAIAIEPDRAELRLNLADTLLAAGDADAAIAAYRDALGRRPQWGEAWNNLGLALRQAGRLLEARQAFDMALQLLPDSPVVRANLATVGSPVK